MTQEDAKLKLLTESVFSYLSLRWLMPSNVAA